MGRWAASCSLGSKVAGGGGKVEGAGLRQSREHLLKPQERGGGGGGREVDEMWEKRWVRRNGTGRGAVDGKAGRRVGHVTGRRPFHISTQTLLKEMNRPTPQ